MKSIFKLLMALFALSILAGCGYNTIQEKDESVKAAWSETLNQYKRRSDLVPNLVNSVQAYAQHESQVLTDVTEARAKVSQLNLRADEIPSEEQLKKFQAAQNQLGGALSRLMMVSERYPELKSSQLFSDLNAQLEGTENRIATARGRYIKIVQDYNTYIRQFPQTITAKVMGYKAKPNFGVDNEEEIQRRPEVNFNLGGNNNNAPQAQAPAQQPAPQPQQQAPAAQSPALPAPDQQQAPAQQQPAPEQQPAPAPQPAPATEAPAQ